MALLYLLDDDLAVDEEGWEWGLVGGTWHPVEEPNTPHPPKARHLRLVAPPSESMACNDPAEAGWAAKAPSA